MTYVVNTPESLLPRSDSKNPSTTCRGTTQLGKPCRRSPAAAVTVHQGVLGVDPNAEGLNERAAAFFCWQHKGQAAAPASASHGKKRNVLGLRKRTSVDTLVERLEILEIKESKGSKTKTQTRQEHQPIEWRALPKQKHAFPGLLSAVTEESSETRLNVSQPRVSQPRQSRRPKGYLTFHLSLFFCIQAPDQEYEHNPAPRIRHTQTGRRPPEMAQMPKPQSTKRPVVAQHSSLKQSSNSHSPQISPKTDKRPPLNKESLPRSQTHALLALIPPNLSPQTTSLLLAELAKPLPPSSEPGYIYMFWLTPSSTPTPSSDTASSLLAPPTTACHQPSSPAQPSALPAHTIPAASKPIMLKIGRASNVQRRLNEWTRQCGYNLSLIRYYPYHPSSPRAQPPSPIPSPRARHAVGGAVDASMQQDAAYPRKVPHVARVERLIHLELAEKRAKRLCAGCEREHREWFEVEATREGLRAVDEVVRRWVAWGAEID